MIINISHMANAITKIRNKVSFSRRQKVPKYIYILVASLAYKIILYALRCLEYECLINMTKLVQQVSASKQEEHYVACV